MAIEVLLRGGKALEIICDRFDEFIETFSPYISADGLFVETDMEPRKGLELDVIVRLADGFQLLQAKALVAWNRRQDTLDRPDGVGLHFLQIEEGQQLVDKIASSWSDGGGVLFDIEREGPFDPNATRPLSTEDIEKLLAHGGRTELEAQMADLATQFDPGQAPEFAPGFGRAGLEDSSAPVPEDLGKLLAHDEQPREESWSDLEEKPETQVQPPRDLDPIEELAGELGEELAELVDLAEPDQAEPEGTLSQVVAAQIGEITHLPGSGSRSQAADAGSGGAESGEEVELRLDSGPVDTSQLRAEHTARQRKIVVEPGPATPIFEKAPLPGEPVPEQPPTPMPMPATETVPMPADLLQQATPVAEPEIVDILDVPTAAVARDDLGFGDDTGVGDDTEDPLPSVELGYPYQRLERSAFRPSSTQFLLALLLITIMAAGIFFVTQYVENSGDESNDANDSAYTSDGGGNGGDEVPQPGDPARQILEVTWEEDEGGTRLRLQADGYISQQRIQRFRLPGPQPREVIKILDIREPPFPQRYAIDGTHAASLRFGQHRINGRDELHAVIDLADPDVEMGQIEVDGSAVIVTLQRP